MTTRTPKKRRANELAYQESQVNIAEKARLKKLHIIEAALITSARLGVQGLVRDKIAAEADIASSLIYKYFGDMTALRETIIQAAFDRGNIAVLYKSLTIEDFKKRNTNQTLAKQLCEYLMKP